MEEVLGVVRSSLTVPPPSSSPAAAAETELALAAEQPLEVVDEVLARGHGGTDLDALPWKHNGSEGGRVYTGKGVGIEGDLEVEDNG